MQKETYVCRYCGTNKSLSTDNFKPEFRTKHGWDTVCRECRRAERNKRRAENREIVLLKEAAYRRTPSYQKYHQKYWEHNRERLNDAGKRRYMEDPTPYLQRSKEQKVRDPEGYKKYQKEWRKTNRERINKYIVNRLHTNINFKLRHTLRCKLRKILNGLNKTNSALVYLGCSIDFFRGYLEGKFTPAMTWDNYGVIWHIDHILPCSSFDMTKESDREKCFHYTNLQPLLAIDNLVKGDKLPVDISEGNGIIGT